MKSFIWRLMGLMKILWSFFSHLRLRIKNGARLTLTQNMSKLLFNTVFREVSSMFRGETFSTMYFGQHLGKNLLILKHDLTVMIVFGEDQNWSSPEFVKAVSFKGERRKGVKIAGNENTILLLDENGHLWRLINAFEVAEEESACLHSLNEKYFYQWIPFKKFNLVKVLNFSATKHGFACIGLGENLKKKLIILSSSDAVSNDFTFEELNLTTSSSYYLTNLYMNAHQNPSTSQAEEALLVTDRFSGKTYLCENDGRTSVINISNHFLISALHFPQKKCLLLSFESGKLTFLLFPHRFSKQCDVYLSRNIVFIEKCCCSDTCLLWSDGIILRHSKLNFGGTEDLVKVLHLKLNHSLQNPVCLLKIHQNALIVNINNFYYSVNSGVEPSEEVKKRPQEILLDISNGSSLVGELEENTELLTHYLHWKDIIEKDKIKGKLQMQWEGNNSVIVKNSLEIPLKEEIWKLRLSTSDLRKTFVHLFDLDGHLNKGNCVTVENPFKTKCQVKLSFVGHFNEEHLYLNLGKIEEFKTIENNFRKNQLFETLEKILRKRKKIYHKGN